MPKDTLTQISRELRSTHFHLGGSGPTYETVHQHQYRQHTVSPVTLHRPKEAQLALGKEGSRLVGATEMTAQYTTHPGESRVVLSQQAKNELRAHHFGLGADRPTYVTHHMETYPPKPLDLNVSLDSAARVRNVRKAHFTLGNDTYASASIAKTDFTPKTVEKVDEEKYLSEMRKGLRMSHFQTGNNPQTYLSTARKDFTGAQGPSAALNTVEKDNLRREHFVLGAEPTELTTVNQDTYTVKKEGRQELSYEKLRDLRSSHFVLGQSDVTYQPVSHSFHKPQVPVSTSHPANVSKDLRGTHFALGTDANTWQSVYSAAHKVSGPVSFQLSDGAAKGRQSHFALGNGPVVGDSCSHRDYRALSAAPNRLDPENEKSLRGHHFQLGLDPSQRYKSANAEYGTQQGRPSSLDAARKQDLRATHFNYGSEQPSFQTNHQLQYPNRSGESISPERVKNTRKSHFDLGERKEGGYSTTYKGTYNWIQPQPDRDYKFTIQK